MRAREVEQQMSRARRVMRPQMARQLTFYFYSRAQRTKLAVTQRTNLEPRIVELAQALGLHSV